MMPQNKSNWFWRFPFPKAALLTLLFLYANTVLAQSSSDQINTQSSFSVVEILLLIAGIVVLILIAWFLVGRQTDENPHSSPGVHRKHYDHPNDPHFRKLKKKTS